MTAVADRDDTAELVESSELETRLAVQRAIDRSHLSREELADQARRDEFSSVSARLAWSAIRDFGYVSPITSLPWHDSTSARELGSSQGN